jgi:hypothetical protein
MEASVGAIAVEEGISVSEGEVASRETRRERNLSTWQYMSPHLWKRRESRERKMKMTL